MEPIKVYGANWCGLTRRTLARLDELEVTYDYIDVDHNPEASEWVKSQNNGKEKKPTLDIHGKVVTAPSNQKLEEILRAEQVLV